MFDPSGYGYWSIDYCVIHKGQLICPAKERAEPITMTTTPSCYSFCYHCGRTMATSYFYATDGVPKTKMVDPWSLYGYEAGGTKDEFGFSVLCKECWSQLTPYQRLSYHLLQAKESNWYLEVERIKNAVLTE